MNKTSLWQKVRAFLASNEAMLAAVLLTYVVLVGGALAGIHWELKPGVAFTRLLEHRWVAGSQALLSLALLVLMRHGRSWPWLVRAVAGGSALTAVYHLFYFFVGTEILLGAAATRIAAHFGRRDCGC
ncbi:MAG TPA: hypothetical protein VLJ58_22910 [Ramlibacter sp.]|nr:hypothetical protein [Ramlibacter sp.]